MMHLAFIASMLLVLRGTSLRLPFPSKFAKFLSEDSKRSFSKILHSRLSSTQSSTEVSGDKSYGADAITVLKGLEPVRKRPGMYIGSTGPRGLHHLVFEVVDNSVDEALAGHCNHIDVIIHADNSIEVRDNGRGIPCGIHPSTGKSSLETVLCVLHAGGKFGGDESGYKVSGGLHGVGISVVNALSEHLQVSVVRDGFYHTMTFSKGEPLKDIEKRPALVSEQRGTTVFFRPDPLIFKTTTEFEFEKLSGRLDELAYLNAGLTITLEDKRIGSTPTLSAKELIGEESDDSEESTNSKTKRKLPPSTESPSADSHQGQLHQSAFRKSVFRHDGGIKELVSALCEGKTNLHPEKDIIYIKEERKGITVEVSMRWSKDQYNDNLSGFANGISTTDGGSHLEGLKTAVTRTINTMAKKAGKIKDSNIPGEFLREGLTSVVSVKVPEPEFEGQTKTRLGNPEVRQIVDQIVSDSLQTLFEWNNQILFDICAKALDAQAAASAAKAARDMVRRKSLLHSTVLPGKLADCASRNAAEAEIYIVEGDSAAGSAKLGRDRRFQAILPLRGKILNIEKAANDKIYQNSELQALISALGLGVRGTDFDSELLRYHRIIIMTDADVDGAHIRLLLLTFLYRYQKELIMKGFVYIACPPLYKVVSRRDSKSITYLYDQEAFDAHMKGIGPASNVQIQRFKGLGEMMPQQLWETTMDPSKRTLKLVTIDDAAAADRLFSTLMGDSVQPRKEFIISNVDRLKLTDLDY